MDAILLLGHGSMREQANAMLMRVAELVRNRLPGKAVHPAFMQFGKPDFFEGAKACIEAGATRVIVHPYFLAAGDHVTKDIPGMMADMSEKHPGVKFVMTKPLGIHDNLAGVVAERVAEAVGESVAGTGAKMSPGMIEAASFHVIDTELGRLLHDAKMHSIIRRVIHATGDFTFADNMRFHARAVEAGVEAIRAGKNILADVHMVEAGINKALLARFGGRVLCGISDADIAKEAIATGQTRAEVAIERHTRDNIGIVAVGNAPTALMRAMDLIEFGAFAPELVVGVPVGFVNAAESKERLSKQDYPFITSLGRKGGSPVAAATVNAIMKLAEAE
ncbi:MAG: precorrin-8X methylmutase [Nitrospirae bacterium]|nr:precorrin-8X methylmutase [Nitrospirota bacterium]